MSRPQRFVLATATFAALSIICLLMAIPRIEADIRVRTEEALAGAGMTNVTVDVRGRNISLSGSQIELDRASGVMTEVNGVRITTLLLTTGPVVAPPPAAVAQPTIQPPSTDDLNNQIRDLIDGRPIRFRTGSAQLLPASRDILDELTVLLLGADVRIEIEGHTDGTGGAQRNLALSQQRAEAVRTYLISQGIEGTRLTATGVGAARPVASDRTAAGRQRNRRIEFNVTSPS